MESRRMKTGHKVKIVTGAKRNNAYCDASGDHGEKHNIGDNKMLKAAIRFKYQA